LVNRTRYEALAVAGNIPCAGLQWQTRVLLLHKDEYFSNMRVLWIRGRAERTAAATIKPEQA
jgi:hypothetical protein